MINPEMINEVNDIYMNDGKTILEIKSLPYFDKMPYDLLEEKSFKKCDRKNTLFLLWQSQDNYQIIKLKEKGRIATQTFKGDELSVEVESEPYISATGALLIPLMLSHAEKKINLNYINESTAKFSLTFKEFNDVSNRL